MKKKVTNEELRQAKRQYAETLQRTTARYANILSAEMREACGDMALWRCLQCYDPSFGQSVSSSLFRFIHWECRKAIRELNNMVQCGELREQETEDKTPCLTMMVNDCLSTLSSRDRRMVEARYLHRCTLQEIANQEGYSRQGVKNILDRCLSRMAKAS